ncbi:MAG: Co2+/Mg2+ efflux protein ApaG [Rhizobiaceae bacterium]
MFNPNNPAFSTDGRYMAVTQHIRVLVEPRFLDSQSDPDSNRYFWAYTIEIRNEGHETVQLQRRYWEITDGLGEVQYVEGEGVVGEQPVLKPGEAFEYTSGCPLSTQSGFMVGYYKMSSQHGEAFEVNIPAFALDMPSTSRTVN